MRRVVSFARRAVLAVAPLALLGGSGLAQADAPGKLLRSAVPVTGEYIVVLKAAPAVQAAEVSALFSTYAALAQKHEAAITQRYSAAVTGFAARMTAAQAEALAADPSVAFVEENGVVRASATQTGATWGLDRIDQNALPLDTKFQHLGQGEGATVYVIDTGVLDTHTEFTGRMVAGFTAINDGRGTVDCNGHGSHVAGTAAGTVYGVAKKAKIVPVRVLDCNGSGTNAGVIAGIDYVTAQKAPRSVANMSLGGAASDAVDQAVQRAIDAGVVMAVAAGNDNANACNYSPARATNAITVGATAINDARSSFSNFGVCVDLSAPGTGITSAWFDSTTATRTISGTSMATPHVAGAVAAYRAANPAATPADVVAAIKAKAWKDKISDVQGSPNLLLNARFVDTQAPVAQITAPTAGATLGSAFVVSVNVTEANLESVALALDGAVISTKLAAPFDFQVSSLAPGAHTVTVTVTDQAGLATTATTAVTVAASTGGGGGGTGGGGGGGGGTGGGTGDGDGGAGSEVTGGCSTSGDGGGLALGLLGVVALARRRRRR